MYGNEPAAWSNSLQGMSRLRAITNYLTRMRLVDADGVMDFAHKGALVGKTLRIAALVSDTGCAPTRTNFVRSLGGA
jgi:diadenosine tetraphosphatase ApaH/serine/threonine PP2A family protein phosphatase